MSRTMGIDLGDRRIGLALSDPMNIIASPHSVIDRKKTSDHLFQIERLIKDLQITRLVVGLPLNMKGEDTKQTTIVREFVDELKNRIDIPVIIVDERWSSISAKKILSDSGVKTGHEKDHVNAMAASIILQEYLDSKL